MSLANPPLPWPEIDTVLLDMDGTLLDLGYDNHIWNRRLPEAYAVRLSTAVGSPSGFAPVPTDAEVNAARDRLYAHMAEVRGTIRYYELNYWIEFTGVDLLALHDAHRDLIRYRPAAELFLQWLAHTGRRRILATNAHRDSLHIKDAQCQLLRALDGDFSAHDFGYAKESPLFWQALRRAVGYEPDRTLFIDDNAAVLASAEQAGIAHLRMVAQPDREQPARSDLPYPAFNDFRELMPEQRTTSAASPSVSGAEP